MIFMITSHDVKEIYWSACSAFISTFKYYSDESDHGFVPGDLNSDFSDFDQDIFGCGEITSEIETMVEHTWEICDPFDKVYGTTTSKLIK